MMHNRWRRQQPDSFSIYNEILQAILYISFFCWMVREYEWLLAAFACSMFVFHTMRIILWYSPDAYVEPKGHEETCEEVRERLTDMIPGAFWREARKINRAGRYHVHASIHVTEYRNPGGGEGGRE